MKHLFWALLVLSATTIIGCKDEAEDAPPANEAFFGNYTVDYTGSGGLSGTTPGTTTLRISRGDTDDLIAIEVTLDITATVFGQTADVPLGLEVQGYVEDNRFAVPASTINVPIELGPLPVALDISFSMNGTLDGDNLVATLDLDGTLDGAIDMEGSR